jgi:hypothetical protein
MPVFGSPSCDIHGARWVRCMRIAEQRMLAEGWNPHARKFAAVRKKRAMRLWNDGTT